MEMTSRISLLFVPLLAQSLGLPLFQIFLITAFMLLPMVFTYAFSHLADKYDKLTLIIYGIAFSLFPLIFLTTTDGPIEIAIASSIISLCLALLQPSVLGLAGSLAPTKEKHSVVQLELFFQSIGAIVGAVGLGAISNLYGIQSAFLVVAATAVIFLIIAFYLHFHIDAKQNSEEIKNLKKQPKTTFRKIIEHVHFDAGRHTQ
jgi:MFS family permease